MLIGWSPLQSSAKSSQPAAYLFDDVVWKKVGKEYVEEPRGISPELLSGSIGVFSRTVHMLHFKKKYRVCTLSFHQDEIDLEAFNGGEFEIRKRVAATIETFLELAFAGIPKLHRPPVLVGTHTHTGRLELNIAMPRFIKTELGQIRSYNPHPPQRGSQNSWDAFGNFICSRFEWKNPRYEESLIPIKGPNWVEKELAAADRNSIVIQKDQQILHFVQEAKSLAWQSVTGSNASFQTALERIAQRAGFDFEWHDNGRLVLKPNDNQRPIALRGYLLERDQMRQCIDPAASAILGNKFVERWRRRAEYNNFTFGLGQWVTEEPDFESLTENPTLVIPQCHPDWSRFGTRVVPKDPFTFGFAAALKALRKMLIGRIAATMFFSTIEKTDIEAVRNLRKHMEKSENVKKYKYSGVPCRLDARVMRSTATSLRAAERAGTGGNDEGTPKRIFQHSRVDGAPDLSGRNSLAKEQCNRGINTCPELTGAKLPKYTYRYQLDSKSNGTSVTRRIDLIGRIRSLRPDLLGFSGSAEDGATYFSFPDCEMGSWPNGRAEVVGDIGESGAEALVHDLANILQSSILKMVSTLDTEASEIEEEEPSEDFSH